MVEAVFAPGEAVQVGRLNGGGRDGAAGEAMSGECVAQGVGVVHCAGRYRVPAGRLQAGGESGRGFVPGAAGYPQRGAGMTKLWGAGVTELARAGVAVVFCVWGRQWSLGCFGVGDQAVGTDEADVDFGGFAAGVVVEVDAWDVFAAAFGDF